MEKEHISEDFSIEALKRGDRRAFEIVYSQYYQALSFFAEQVVKDHFAAKEIVQEVFVKLWEGKIATDIQNLKSYLFTATRNSCLNYLEKSSRKQRRKQEYSYIAPLSEEGILRNMIHAEVMREVAFAIEKLPQRCKKVIRMTFEEGKTSNEIAHELNIAISTVRNQKARGLGLLKKLLSQTTFLILLTLIR